MKKLQPGLLVAVLALTFLTGCGSSKSDGTYRPNQTPSSLEPADEPNNTANIDSVLSQLQETQNYINKNPELDPNEVNERMKSLEKNYNDFIKTIKNVNDYSQIRDIDKDVDLSLRSAIGLSEDLKNKKVRQVKTRLKDKKFYDGKLDDILDNNTKKVLSKYYIVYIDEYASKLKKLNELKDELKHNEGSATQPNGSTTANSSISGWLLVISIMLSLIIIFLALTLYLIIEYYKKGNKKFQDFETSQQRIPDENQKLLSGIFQDQINLVKQEIKQIIDDSLKNIPSEAIIRTMLHQNSSQFSVSQIEKSISTLDKKFSGIISDKKISSELTAQISQLTVQISQQMDRLNEWLKISEGKNTPPPEERSGKQIIEVTNNEELSSQIRDLQSENDNLKYKVSELEYRIQGLTSLESENQKLKEVVSALSEQLNKADLKTQQDKQYSQDYENRLSQLQNKLSNMELECNNLQTKLRQEKGEKELINNELIKIREQRQKVPPVTPSPVPKLESLPASITSFVAIYNRNPNSLKEHTHIQEVTVDGQSVSIHRNNTKQPIILKIPNTGFSEYFIVSDNSGGVSSVYFLFPKENTISVAESRIIQFLFECHDYREEGVSKFIMIKPAKVLRNPTNEQEWIFKEQDKGELKFES